MLERAVLQLSKTPSLRWNCMSDILNKTIVLVLNRNWQAIHVRTPQEAFCMMATNVAPAWILTATTTFVL